MTQTYDRTLKCTQSFQSQLILQTFSLNLCVSHLFWNSVARFLYYCRSEISLVLWHFLTRFSAYERVPEVDTHIGLINTTDHLENISVVPAAEVVVVASFSPVSQSHRPG